MTFKNSYFSRGIASLPILFASLLSVTAMATAQTGSPYPSNEALAMLQKHVQAQANFDQKTLDAIMHSQYIEVSPAGEVDERSKVLSFYAIENKKQSPVVEVLEPVFRDVAEGKLVIAKLRYKMQAGEQTRQFSIRASYMLCKEKADWKVCSAQYTGIR
ncbi:nuclear transport factor 2 family protein [Undibacterium seohonense]|uniref:Nuclear transport factor 2 family protein n=1 Tax=Undibacterium seohonense TaxID=1344950 RepID=A0ABR6X2M1_9BURK|nr:nuclear transport factor 2 family protein [Undibacterium seohonense]MBC3807214.1 nuclear transport factor 2 family protein [Undibacterium seohonense]